MATDLEKLEEILGGKLERSDARVLLGTDGATTREAVYFSNDGKNKFGKQFYNITCFADPPNATSGGVNEAGCRITPSLGPTSHAVIYHGDIEGWRKDIEVGADGLDLMLARIEGDKFIISDGRSIPPVRLQDRVLLSVAGTSAMLILPWRKGKEEKCGRFIIN